MERINEIRQRIAEEDLTDRDLIILMEKQGVNPYLTELLCRLIKKANRANETDLQDMVKKILGVPKPLKGHVYAQGDRFCLKCSGTLKVPDTFVDCPDCVPEKQDGDYDGES